MMFDFRGEGWGPKMTLKNRTLGGRWPGGNTVDIEKAEEMCGGRSLRSLSLRWSGNGGMGPCRLGVIGSRLNKKIHICIKMYQNLHTAVFWSQIIVCDYVANFLHNFGNTERLQRFKNACNR